MADSNFRSIKNNIKRVLFPTKNLICNISDNLEPGIYSSIFWSSLICDHANIFQRPVKTFRKLFFERNFFPVRGQSFATAQFYRLKEAKTQH